MRRVYRTGSRTATAKPAITPLDVTHSLETVRSHSRSRRHAWIAIVDTLMLLMFLALMSPSGASGFVLHEWIGLAFVPFFGIHVALSWNWIVGGWRRVRREAESRTKINFMLNTSLAAMMAVVIVSGLLISTYALPSAGIHTHPAQRWERLHNSTSSLILIVVGLHLGLNWSWIKGAWRRYVVGPLRREETAP